jgi:uncharacterized protein YkwD
MSGAFRFLFLPVAAVSLFLIGCGVPIAPAAITATAVTEEENAPRQATLPAFSGGANDTTTTLLTAGAESADPIPTLPQPTASATPEASATSEATPEAQGGPVDPLGTPAGDAPTPEGSPDPNATPDAAGTPTVTETPSPTPEPTATPQPVVTNVNGSFIAEFVILLNAQRTGRGMTALAFNDTLSGGATEYAGYMGTGGFFGHYAPDGSSPDSRVIATGYGGAYNGEALAAGQWTPQAALNALLASAPHAAILLDPRSVEVGVGYAFVDGSRYRHYWVVVTGIP